MLAARRRPVKPCALVRAATQGRTLGFLGEPRKRAAARLALDREAGRP
jgi:hypothetical protein